jgi:hypothetical protein
VWNNTFETVFCGNALDVCVCARRAMCMNVGDARTFSIHGMDIFAISGVILIALLSGMLFVQRKLILE